MSNIFNDVLKEADIRTVLDYYGLKVDRNKKMLCPFHPDKNPSMSLHEKKQIVKCFTCNEGGNAITFVYKYENEVNKNGITYNDAIKKVAEICNINIDLSEINKKVEDNKYTTASRKYSEEQKGLLSINEWLANLFNYMLLTKDGKVAKQYLEDRGITHELADEMNFGFVPKDFLINITSKKSDITIHQLVEIGLLELNNYNEPYEKFVDRIMIPIYDEKGNIVSFSGRSIKDEVTPKYLHTSETDIFHKRELLYNFHDAKKLIYGKEVYLVEGYFDVAGGKRMGINNVVATMGTNITEEQKALLKRYNCSLILAYDNDFDKEKNHGKDAMLRQIPDLLKEGFKVEVSDISKIGEFKDFDNLASNNIKKEDIENNTIPAFTYLLANKYFLSIKMTVLEINEAYNKAKEDGVMDNSLQQTMFKEYVKENTSFSFDEINDIIYPKSIEDKENPIDRLKLNIFEKFIVNSVNELISQKTDDVLSHYLSLNQESINQCLFNSFHENTEKYINEADNSLNINLLLEDVLSQDDSYAKYETIHRFGFENVFNKCYIKNQNGQRGVMLSDAQKQLVVKQFEDTLSDSDKLALEEVEELYIINDVADLDGILPQSNNNLLNMLKDKIKTRMFLYKEQMDFFKYGSLFAKSEKEFISSEFKGKSGEYKTILFYNNLSDSLKLVQANILKENDTKEIEQSKEQSTPEKTNDQVDISLSEKQTDNSNFDFSIHQSLFVPERETDTQYFVRVPNTQAKDYIYIPKEECEWRTEETAFYSLKAGKKYNIYDHYGKFKYEQPYSKLKAYWDDKTKKVKETYQKPQNTFNSQKNTEEVLPKKTLTINKETNMNKEKKRYTIADTNDNSIKVAVSRILKETESGYYVKTDEENIFLFAIKKICSLNPDKTHLIVKPKSSIIGNTGVSKYNGTLDEKKFIKNLSYSEIAKYWKLSNSDKIDKVKILISKDNINFKSNFLHIPIAINHVVGYFVLSNEFIKEITDTDISILANKNASISFYSKENKYINSYNITDIKTMYEDYKKNVSTIQKELPLSKISQFNSDKGKTINDVNIELLVNNTLQEVYFFTEQDELKIIPVNIEVDYDWYERSCHIKLNDEYLYKPKSYSIGPKEVDLRQEGIYKNKEDAIAFIKEKIGNKQLRNTAPSKEVKFNYEKEVA